MDAEQAGEASSSADQGSGQTESVDIDPPVVETNNFAAVLRHFDDAGNLKNERTRFSIPCSICLVHNIDFVNPLLETPGDIIFEPFTVLPNCGHAFGFYCIFQWLYYFELEQPNCPLCKTPVFCARCRESYLYTRMYGVTENLREQRRQITNIRQSMMNRLCRNCWVPLL